MGPTFWLNVNESRCGSVAKLKPELVTAGAAGVIVIDVEAGAPTSSVLSVACAQYV